MLPNKFHKYRIKKKENEEQHIHTHRLKTKKNMSHNPTETTISMRLIHTNDLWMSNVCM